MFRLTITMLFALFMSANSEARQHVFYRSVQRSVSVQTPSGDAYQVALASAQYRAANGIKGHAMHIERGRMVGVGFASSNFNPATCFNNMGGAYAVVRGRDGWYATRVVR